MSRARALFLAALVVASVFSIAVATSGTVSAADVTRGDTSGSWDTTAGEGDVGDEAVVYQGEDDITFVDNGEGPGSAGDEVEPVVLERTSTGAPLQMPIPEDAETGPYSTDGESLDGDNFGVRVEEPEIDDFDINNDDGDDREDSTIGQDNTDAEVAVDYNFEDAEDLEVTVEDASGLDVTDEFIEGPTSLHPEDDDDSSYDVVFEITDLGNVDRGEYTITVQGVDDLTQDDASESTTVTVGEVGGDATISLDESEVPRGENAIFSVDSGAEAHLVTLPRNSYRDDDITVGEAASIFHSLDVEEHGIVTRDAIERDGDSANVHTADDLEDAGLDSETVGQFESSRDTRILYSYAIIDTSGDGAIRTEYLDDSSVEITLYGADDSLVDDEELSDPRQSPGDPVSVYGVSEIDDATLSVTAGSVSLESPQSPYVIGDEVTISGNASENIEDVVIYARDSGDWERVTDRISVGLEDRFEETEFDLSGAAATDIFTIRGTYTIGVIAASDADVDGDGTVDDTIGTGAFAEGTSARKPLRVLDEDFGVEFGFVDGQVAVEDATVHVRGTAPGQEVVDIVFVGSRGNVQHASVPVDDDGTFDEAELDVDTDLLAQGPATAYALSPGSDGVYGTGQQAAGSLDDVEGVPSGSSADGGPDQIRQQLLAHTVNASGSDDMVVIRDFRLTDGTTAIDAVHPENAPDADTVGTGETMIVEGTTNRVPGDSTIVVELLDDTGQAVAVGSTDGWELDGRWSISFAVEDVEPGTYTVRAEDGLTQDRQEIRIVSERETPTPTPQPADDVTPTPLSTPSGDDTAGTQTPAGTPSQSSTPTPSSELSGGSGPGFGVAAAAIALLVATLLIVRRK